MTNISQSDIAHILAAAREVRLNAHAPYSGFAVGAAVLASSGCIYTGCNVENASYGLTICAERNAVAAAVAAGEKSLSAVAIIADASEPVPPCGACRQVLVEFAGDVPVIMENLSGQRRMLSLHELLPWRFEFKK